MPAKLNMVIISNRTLLPPPPMQAPLNTASLSRAPVVAKPSSALNSSIISRIHTTRPGCGGCGRK